MSDPLEIFVYILKCIGEILLFLLPWPIWIALLIVLIIVLVIYFFVIKPAIDKTT